MDRGDRNDAHPVHRHQRWSGAGFLTVDERPGDYRPWTKVVVADLDRDGLLDALAGPTGENATISNGTRVVWGGAGTEMEATLIVETARYVVTDVADLNEDGRPDLVLTSDTNIAVSYARGGRRYEVADPVYTFPEPLYESPEARVVDLDRDRRPELVVTLFDRPTATDHALVLRHGDGVGYELVADQAFPSGTTSGVLSVLDGDVDGDGRSDLAICHAPGFYVSRNLGR